MSRAEARKQVGKAVQLTKSELEEALKAVDAGRSEVADRAGDVVDRAGGTVAAGRKQARKSRRKTKRRAVKARKRIEKALPDLPSTDTVTRRSRGRSKKPFFLVVLAGAGAAAYAFLKGSK